MTAKSDKEYRVEQQPSDNKELVSSHMLFEARKRILQKEEEIDVLQARITHLLRLNDLKDGRIQELSERVSHLTKELLRQHNADWDGLLQADGQTVQMTDRKFED